MKLVTVTMIVGILGLGLLPVGAEEVTSEKMNETLKIIHERKSVRNYTNQDVTRKQLETLVKAGMAAPTAADKRPWAFVVVTKQKKLKAIANVMKYGKMVAQAKAAIVVCGIPKESLPGWDSVYWIQDCSAASENILLAAESMGLGAVWLGVYPNQKRIKNISEILNVPQGTIPLNVISIGWPQGVEKPKKKYDPKKVHWNKW